MIKILAMVMVMIMLLIGGNDNHNDNDHRHDPRNNICNNNAKSNISYMVLITTATILMNILLNNWKITGITLRMLQ